MAENEGIRLNKYLSEAGACSRRAADTYISEGKVCINGKTAEMGQKVMPGDKVTFKGCVVRPADKMVVLAYNKPIGLTCTADERDKDNIFAHIDYPIIQKSVNNHEKEYRVRVNKPVTEEFLRAMGEGVPILDTVTKKCRLKKLDNYSFTIVLTQGLNRQIRRMCDYFGYKVVNLKRIRVMNVRLGDMRPGELRPLTSKEESELRRLVGKN